MQPRMHSIDEIGDAVVTEYSTLQGELEQIDEEERTLGLTPDRIIIYIY